VRQSGGSSGVGVEKLERFAIAYQKEHSLLHFGDRFPLRDIDEAMIMPIINRSMAERIESFSLYANEYEILRVNKGEFRIDSTIFSPCIPAIFSDDETKDAWVRIRAFRGLFKLRSRIFNEYAAPLLFSC
jgi:hypothetical protein